MKLSAADRKCRMSLRYLFAGLGCAALSPLLFFLILKVAPERTGWDGLEDLVWAAVWAFAGLVVAGCFGLLSLGYGMACARERKRVLLWVVPLGLAAAFGLAAGLIQLMLWMDEKRGFIPGGKRDDVATLLAVWLGWVSLISLAYWITSVVYERRFRMFPVWSVPLWAGAITSAMFLLG